MATVLSELGFDLGAREAGFPALGSNQADAAPARTAASVAREVAESHRRRLQARRYRDLTSEKYMLHIDGEGDSQWADILRGVRVAIPRGLPEYRTQENLLRPIVDNAVAYHTTMPFRYAAEGKQDRESRERALVDQAFANHVSQGQRFNHLFAQGMYLSVAAGFCPIHAYWRDDLASDPYEPVWASGMSGQRPGLIDAWCGNPFGMVMNPGAVRDSIQWASYDRVLPAQMVRDAFGDVLARQRVRLEGTTHLPSAAVFQRVARRWHQEALERHGTAVLWPGGEGGRDDDEELIALVCREVAPGVDPRWPQGRLVLIALQGEVDPARGRSGTRAAGEPVLLADQPLPAGRFSFSLLYSHHRFDDVHGKPWAGDLDELQVQLNLARSDRKAYVQRQLRAPTITSGPLVEDMAEYDGYAILELEPGQHGFQPRVLEIPAGPLQAINLEIEDIRRAMYTIGGYQAASRGEGHAGDSGAKIVALQRADDTVHGPVNTVFRDTASDFMGLCWSLMKSYGDVGWIVSVTGDEYAHLADGYIDRTRLSETAPVFRLTSLAGATPESHAQQLLTMVQTRGADGMPFMSTAEARKQWPDQNLFGEITDASAVRRRRARSVVAQIRATVDDFRRRTGMQQTAMNDPWVQQAAAFVAQHIAARFPPFPDDDPAAHVDALSEITQDETEDAVARVVAAIHQRPYLEWQRQIQAQQQMAEQQSARGGGGDRRTALPNRETTPGGTPNSAAMAATMGA